MVRLLGFVALIALVALMLLWTSEHFTPKGPAPEKAAAPAPEIQQPIPRPAPTRETPPPVSPEVAVADPGETAPPAAPTPAPAAPDRETPSPPSDAPAAEAPSEAPAGRLAEALAENQAGTGTEAQAGAGADEGREAGPAPAQDAARSIPAPADDRRTDPAAAPDDAPEAVTAAADQPQAVGGRIEERSIDEEEFVALEQAQGRIDERTDAQRRRQEEDGWYGWGVLNEYADPDRATRLLGGVPVVRTGDRFHTVREQSGRIRVRPIGNVSAAYGAVGLQAHDPALKQHVRRAIASGLLLGRESDHQLLHLFPRREAAHLGNKVVKVFECHLRESGLSGEAADRFREQAKLRGAVVALRRANGGRLGVLLPRYFRTGEGRVPVAAPCREIDDESRRAAMAMAEHPSARPAPGRG